MAKFSFVLLHYNSFEDTFACVDSIDECCRNSEIHIYVVDNASPNGSGELLKKKYEKNSSVTVILSQENLGFAKGNNLGINQAVRDGFADFVVVMNNDTKILQKDFCERVFAAYLESDFAVLGPTIYTPVGKTSINPGRRYVLKGRELKSWENFYNMGLKLIKAKCRLGLKILQKQMGFRQRLKNHSKPKFKHVENCVLHGCCLVFSKKYFEKFDGFDSRTFLYFEEEILYAHVMYANLRTVYAPEVEIWHKEDGATDSIFGDDEKKTAFVYENILKSINVYRKVLAESNR